jgi:dephospho-CoA kinase
MKVIGLTGGIACGKSTVAEMFINNSRIVIDSDKISKSTLDVGSVGYNEVIERFGKEVTLPSGHINRKKLGEIIFNDDDKRKQLNAIVHPKVVEGIKRSMAYHEMEGHEYLVVDIPLLFEAGLEYLVDFVICVRVDKNTQVERLMSRDGVTEAFALKKISSQMPLDKKCELSDEVIDNSNSILDTKKQLNEILKKHGIIL